LPSERSACLTDAECLGRCRPDEECQGICVLNAARVLQTQNVKANFFRTQSVKANVVRTTCAMASAFWTRSVFAIRMQHMVQTQSVNANGR